MGKSVAEWMEVLLRKTLQLDPQGLSRHPGTDMPAVIERQLSLFNRDGRRWSRK